jgi:hypothetical protein
MNISIYSSNSNFSSRGTLEKEVQWRFSYKALPTILKIHTKILVMSINVNSKSRRNAWFEFEIENIIKNKYKYF